MSRAYILLRILIQSYVAYAICHTEKHYETATHPPFNQGNLISCDHDYDYNCIDGTEVWENDYNDHMINFEPREIEVGPHITTCVDTNIQELDFYGQTETNFENKLYIKDSSIYYLDVNGISWKKIIELRLNNTNTSKIIPGFFNSFDVLKVLVITNNNISLIDGVFSSLSNLEEINLSNNVIVNLTEFSFSGLLNLKTIDVSSNKIVFVSEKCFEYQNFLTYLDLSNNLLAHLGHIITLNLNYIDLRGNKIVSLNLLNISRTYIYKLDLGNNSLEIITNLHSVSAFKVDLSLNKITSLGKVADITNLNVSHNNIQHLYNDTFNVNIEILDLSYNNLSNISSNTFENLINLEVLYLNNNNIKFLSVNCFTKLQRLKHLDLSFNKISTISFGLLNNLKMLTFLDISHNNATLDFYSLINIKHLEELKIDHNQLTNFNQKMLFYFPKLRTVSLGDDFWNCSELASIVHSLQLRGITIPGGQNFNVSNILGMSCKDEPNINKETITIIRNNSNISEETSKGIYNAPLQNQHNLNETLFFKFLEKIAWELSNKNVTTTLASNARENDFDQFLNENFTKSNFYKYVENLRYQNITTLPKVSKYFNETNFFKFLNSINISITLPKLPTSLPEIENNDLELLNSIDSLAQDISGDLKLMVASQNSSFKKFLLDYNQIYIQNTYIVNSTNESEASTNIKYLTYYGSLKNELIVTTILLVIILCCVLTITYRMIRKSKKFTFDSSGQSQIEINAIN